MEMMTLLAIDTALESLAKLEESERTDTTRLCAIALSLAYQHLDSSLHTDSE